MEFERYDWCYEHMEKSSNGDYVPYQQAQAVLEQLNSVNAALETHFGPASIAEVSQYVDVYRARIAELEGIARSRDVAVTRWNESSAYVQELRARLNKYEPGTGMHLNTNTDNNTYGKSLYR